MKLHSKWGTARRKWVFILIISLLGACRRGSPDLIIGDLSNNKLKIEVATTGFYQVSLDNLRDAGFTISELSFSNLHLSQAGTVVPFHIVKDNLFFYGQASDNRYTNLRPYILEFGKEGKPMVETAVPIANESLKSQVPQTVHLEENHLYFPEIRQDENSDVWYWHSLIQGQKLSIPIDLPLISNSPAKLRLHLRGTTLNADVDFDHDFDLFLNGQKLDTVRWDGSTLHTSEVPLPPGLLKSGSNELVLDNEVPGASFLDIMELNWIELDYSAPATAVNDRLQFGQLDGRVTLTGFSGAIQIFEISNPATPHVLTGWDDADNQAQFTVESDMEITAIGPRGFLNPATISPLRQSEWRKPGNQADLIIITTDELAPGMTPLIEAREAQGLSVALITAAEIYDEFGFGEKSPESIQDFVAYAYDHWADPHPRYLFLVGDATTDYHNYQDNKPRNNIPSLLVPVEFSGETVSDSRLADVDGDMKPDLAIGRWPVNSLKDVENLVERTLAYEHGTAANRALFITDGTEPQFATIASNLSENSELKNENTAQKNGATVDEVTTSWNQGAWITTYIGHGSVERWGKEDIFFPEAVKDLNADSPPIVLQLTCLSGLFAHPDLQSLSETMLLDDHGPVLSIGATSLTLSSHQEPFALSLLQNLQVPKNTRIGDAFQEAKQSLAIEGNNGLREISDTFVLLGDPSARIIRPNP